MKTYIWYKAKIAKECLFLACMIGCIVLVGVALVEVL